MNAEEIKSYWDKRADKGQQATTDDVYMRTIETRCLIEEIKNIKTKYILDIGCGDGRTTFEVARYFKDKDVVGIDFSENMIDLAKSVSGGLDNLDFGYGDVLDYDGCSDIVITVRCIINLPTWEAQQRAFLNIYRMLPKNGTYIMIENFMDSHWKMNIARLGLSLDIIDQREHNLFLAEQATRNFLKNMFNIIKSENISSYL